MRSRCRCSGWRCSWPLQAWTCAGSTIPPTSGSCSSTAALNAALAYGTGVAARKRRDRRVHLVSLAFLAAAGFLALHALATPGVLLDKSNLGFVIATPIGLLVAGALVRVLGASRPRGSALRCSRPASSPRSPSGPRSRCLLLPDVDDAAIPARLSLPLVVLCVRRRPSSTPSPSPATSRSTGRAARQLVLGFTLAFVLLAEAMVAIAFGRNWQASWWEWHVLMLTAFALIAVMAHREGPEERFGRLYGERAAGPDGALRRPEGVHDAGRSGRDPREVSAMLDVALRRGDPGDRAARRASRPVDRRRRVRALQSDGTASGGPGGARAAGAERLARARRIRTGPASVSASTPARSSLGRRSAPASGRTYSALGDTVNLGSRIEGLAPPGGDRAQRGDRVRHSPGRPLRPLGTVTVKGRAEPVEVLLLRAASPEWLAAGLADADAEHLGRDAPRRRTPRTRPRTPTGTARRRRDSGGASRRRTADTPPAARARPRGSSAARQPQPRQNDT